MRPASRVLPPVAVFGLCGAVLACSGGGDRELSDAEAVYAAAFAEDFANSGYGIVVDDDEARCMSDAIMAEVGVEPFEDAEVGPDELDGAAGRELLSGGAISAAQARDIYATWDDCADMPRAFAAGAGKQFDADDEAVACLEEGLRDDDALEQYVVESFTGGVEPDPAAPGVSAILELISECTARGSGTSGAIVSSIERSLIESGRLTEEQAHCVAESVVDDVGAEALLQGGVSESFESASPQLDAQVVQAMTDAAEACDVPLAQLGGG
ncbi:MAG: hypothetical protein ACRDYW_04550 [Acidimicrobiales bacterium]